jgi:methyl-accepting chemotaxis protein
MTEPINPAKQRPRFFRTLRMFPRIMILSVSGVLLLGICLTGVLWYVLQAGATKAAVERVETNARVAWNVVRTNGESFSSVDGKLLVNNHVLNDDLATVDKVKSLVGGTFTIFLDDMRIATNVQKPDGTRAVGTRLARGPAYEAVIDRKTPFRGEVEILGTLYMTAYDPILDTSGKLLGIMYVGIKKAEFMEAAYSTLLSIVYSTLVAVLLTMAASYIATRSLIRPLKKLTGAMHELAEGNFQVVLPGLDRSDEVGDIAQAVEDFKVKAVDKARDEAEAKINQDRVTALQRKAEMIKLADSFEAAVGETIETVSSASTQLEAFAGTLTATAKRTQELTITVAGLSEVASTNVQSVASATEELSSSVNEISRQVQNSARIANEAVMQAGQTNDRIGLLAVAATRIGDVVELINNIAGQTNLLALNATIEAARAGESGRGFAVVASEVKVLAEQTAKATGEISQQITGMQAATRESVEAIKEIGDTIGKMSEIASTIASTIEQQGMATQEISRNVQQAAHGTQQVSFNIGDVQRGASETGSASAQVLSAARSLAADSTSLKAQVGAFLKTVRVA